MSEPLHAALDVTAIPDQLTGAGIYVRALAGALAARDDVALEVVSRRGDARRWGELSAAQVLPLAPNHLPARLAFGELGLGLALRRRTTAEVLHAPHYSMPRAAGVPVVVTVHDLTLVEHPEWHERAKVHYFGHALRDATRRAARLICPSEHTAERLRSLFSPRAEIDVIAHGVDHARFTPEEPAPGADAAALGAAGVGGRYVLFLGTIEPRKNVDRLVAAFDLLARRDPGLTLVLAGKRGWHDASLDAALGRAVHHRRVRELGYVSHALAPALLRQAAAVAYPSSAEGFGLPALEALACGAPLVTSADSAMAELAGAAAFLDDEGRPDSLAEALAVAMDQGAARRQAGVERAAAFTWERSAAAHLVSYRAACG